MFIKLIANVNGTAVEKTFDSLKSLKENYLSMTMAHKIESVILMNGSDDEQYNRALAVLVGYEEEDKLIGLAYICETFSSLEELYNSLGIPVDCIVKNTFKTMTKIWKTCYLANQSEISLKQL